jgi:hypothetical protein
MSSVKKDLAGYSVREDAIRSVIHSYTKLQADPSQSLTSEQFFQVLSKQGYQKDRILQIIEQYALPLLEITDIESRFERVEKNPNYVGKDVDLIATARERNDQLYQALQNIILPQYTASPLSEDTLKKQFQSIYVRTQNQHAKNNGLEFVLSASDLDKKNMGTPVTETAFIRTVDQLIACWLKFAITGDINIFAIAPMTFVTGMATLSITTSESDGEYVSIYCLFDDNMEQQGIVKEMETKIHELFTALQNNGSHFSLHFIGPVCEIKMRKREVLKSPNYDSNKGRLPIALHAITVPLDQNVVIQTGFSTFPTDLQNPEEIGKILKKLYLHGAAEYTDILEEGLELLTDANVALSDYLVEQAQTKFRSGLQNEIRNLHYEVHLWFQYFSRYLSSPKPVHERQMESLHRLLKTTPVPAYVDITKTLFYDLYILTQQQHSLVRKMDRFSELLETYEKTSSLGQRKIIYPLSILEQTIANFPKVVISAQYIPQYLESTLCPRFPAEVTAQLSDIPVIGYELFPELAHYYFIMNAAKHNPDRAHISIQIDADLVKFNPEDDQLWLRLRYTNAGNPAPESVFRQLHDISQNRIYSLYSNGSGISLKNALELTCIQAGVSFSNSNQVFGIENTEDGFMVWYVLPLAKRALKHIPASALQHIPSLNRDMVYS